MFGGAKVSSKLKVIEYYVKNFSKIIIGGAMANTFLAALEKNVGSSIYEKSMIKTAQTFLNQFSEKILLPDDAFVMDKSKKIHLRKIDEIKKDEKFMILDLKQECNITMLYLNAVHYYGMVL